MPEPVKWNFKRYPMGGMDEIAEWSTVIDGDGYIVMRRPGSELFHASTRCETIGKFETLIGAATACLARAGVDADNANMQLEGIDHA